mgnify:CR=1 FL=1
MIKRKPNLPNIKEKINIICEGDGDKLYLDKVLNFYNVKYKINVQPSNSINLIVDELKKVLKINSLNEYYVFFDSDGDYQNRYNQIVKELKKEEIDYKGKIFFVNPLIEYLFLINKVDRHPTTFIKKEQYSPLIEKYFNIENYEGTVKQYKDIGCQITKESFEKYINKVSNDFNVIPSSNILDLIEKIK